MKTRDERIRFVIQHSDGSFLNIHGEHRSDFMKVERWGSVEDIRAFLYGYYAPTNPYEYHAKPVRITYELWEENEDEHLPKVN